MRLPDRPMVHRFHGEGRFSQISGKIAVGLHQSVAFVKPMRGFPKIGGRHLKLGALVLTGEMFRCFDQAPADLPAAMNF